MSNMNMAMKKVRIKGPRKDLRTNTDDFFNYLQCLANILKHDVQEKIVPNRFG